MITAPLLRVFRRTADTLDRAGIPFALLGGFAVRVWGLPRPTFDLDISVAIPRDDVPHLLTVLETAGFDVPEAHAKGYLDTLRGMSKLTVARVEGGHAWDVDVFLASTPFLKSAFRRAIREEVEGISTRVLAPEDVILLKLVAARPRDLVDVQEVLLVVGRLDLTRMRRWASRLGVEKRLARALRESGRG